MCTVQSSSLCFTLFQLIPFCVLTYFVKHNFYALNLQSYLLKAFLKHILYIIILNSTQIISNVRKNADDLKLEFIVYLILFIKETT